MNKLNNLIKSLTAAALLTGLAINFNACSENSPVTPENNSQQIRFVQFPGNHNSLQKIITESKWISAANGGTVNLEYEADDGDLDYEVEISLHIPAGTMTQSALISLAIDDEDFASYLDVNFEPHGTTFSTPAILNIEIEDLDLSGFDLNAINVYYDNTETGQWEVMQCDAIYIDEADGEIEVVNAKLPHFSRYAIGSE